MLKTLKLGCFWGGNQGGLFHADGGPRNWKSIFYTRNIKETPSILTKCCWQDFDALATRIAAAASGHWRNPGIIRQDRGAYWCLSSRIDVRSYYIPFPGDVTYPGAVCVLLENDTPRQSVLIKLDGLQFRCNPCLYARCVICCQWVLSWKRGSKRGCGGGLRIWLS